MIEIENRLRFMEQKDPKMGDADYQKYIDDIYNSASWKVGNALIQPLHWLKKLVKQ